jgi:TPR repeat protein
MKANRQIAIFLGLLLIVAVPARAQENEYSGKMIAEIKAKAEAGDATAQCDLGLAYCNSDGVTKDFEIRSPKQRESGIQSRGLL